MLVRLWCIYSTISSYYHSLLRQVSNSNSYTRPAHLKAGFVLYNRALAYREQGDLDKAVADLNAAIQAKPDFADAFNARALIYVDQQDYNSAQRRIVLACRI